jgi:hypothetical protein
MEPNGIRTFFSVRLSHVKKLFHDCEDGLLESGFAGVTGGLATGGWVDTGTAVGFVGGLAAGFLTGFGLATHVLYGEFADTALHSSLLLQSLFPEHLLTQIPCKHEWPA